MTRLISNAVLDEAMAPIYKRRQHDSHNSDIGSFHLNWTQYRNAIRAQLLQGRYQGSPVQLFDLPDAGRLTRWCSADAVVLKAIALCLGPLLDHHIVRRCTDLKSRCTLKGAYRTLKENITHVHVDLTFWDSVFPTKALLAWRKRRYQTLKND
ncbi:MAG: hypothetical protein COB66_02085 [Coxiella sp. (in: Bacteria)]|nr:MAG: hypothetical protein COB66_02085 [Coxiella sp. (in: g-proteobacteria)]